jgi:hypothetical protein
VPDPVHLEQQDVRSTPGEQQGERCAGDAAADDRNLAPMLTAGELRARRPGGVL